MINLDDHEHKDSKKSKHRKDRLPEHVEEAHDAAHEEERRMRRRLRRAKKMAKHLEELGLDENGDELDNFSLTKYPVREWKFVIPGMSDKVALNPVVTLLSVVFFWGSVYWCTVDTDNAVVKLDEWRTSISLHFTWLIHGAKAIFFFTMLFVAYKYGDIHVGNKDDKPEFSAFTYSAMIYTVGTANALIVYSASEPLSHQSYHFYAQTGYRSQDELDAFAVNLTVHDWGFGCWSPLAVVAVAMSLASYRFGMPLTYRSCLYPVLGAYTWGWIGDVVDGFMIVATLATIFTSLGLAVTSLVAGFVYMGWSDAKNTDDQLIAMQSAVVWILTIVSLLSVVSGLKGGIRLVCLFAMGSACLLLFLIFVMDDSKYLLNLQVQEIGSYLQTSILQLNFWTDAFGQLREGSGRAVDGKAAEQWWFAYWLNFGQSWWYASSAMNGQFIARISKGRKLREVIMYTLVVPVAYGLAWFCVWGGIALRQSRQALELEALGGAYFNNSAHFLNSGNEFCYDVPQDDIVVDDVVVFTNNLKGVTPVCKFDEENGDSASFNVMNSFSFPASFQNGGYGPALSLIFMLACALFFMSCAGAGSLMADTMASSGRKNNHLARRMFWLVSVGALTTALLSTSGGDALMAIQAAMVIFGLPCAVILLYVLQSVMAMCQQAAMQEVGDYVPLNRPEFVTPVYGGIFNVFEYCFSLGKVNQLRLDQGMGSVSSVQVTDFIKGLVVPFVQLHSFLCAAYPQSQKTNAALVGCYAVSYTAWVGFWFASIKWSGMTSLAWLCLLLHGGLLATIRSSYRSRWNIRSNSIADLLASMLLWPQVLSQLRQHCDSVDGDSRKNQSNAE